MTKEKKVTVKTKDLVEFEMYNGEKVRGVIEGAYGDDWSVEIIGGSSRFSKVWGNVILINLSNGRNYISEKRIVRAKVLSKNMYMKKEDYLEIIDIALDKRDKAWFNLLVGKMNALE